VADGLPSDHQAGAAKAIPRQNGPVRHSVWAGRDRRRALGGGVMMCPDCGKLRHDGPCPDTCEACGWPLEAGEDRLCHECAIELAEIDAEQALRRFEDVVRTAQQGAWKQ
jgi:hypothetical protein